MQHLVLLHGAIGAADQLMSLKEQLSQDYSIHSINFPGHGPEPVSAETFSIESFADYTLSYLEKEGIRQANFFGYSMGGYVGMYIARHHPARILKLVTLATKFYWNEAVAANEVKMIDPPVILKKVPAFAKELEARHAGWHDVLYKTANMLTDLGKDNVLKGPDYSLINTPALLLVGDQDKMVSIEETLSVFKQLSNAGMGVMPNTPHPFSQVDQRLLSIFIKRFLNSYIY